MNASLALSLSLLVASASAQAPDDPLVDFEALGQAFVAEHCGGDAPCALDAVLAERGFVDVGPFRVFFPRDMLVDKERVEHLKQAVLGLYAGCESWVTWQGAGDKLPDVDKPLKKWASKWKPLKEKELASKPDARELFELVDTGDDVRAAFADLVALCDSKDDLSLVIPEGRQMRLILAPTRKEFMRWIGYGGLIDASMQHANWVEGAESWAQFWQGLDLVLALEYAPWDGFDPTFERAQPMERIGKGVLAQHVVQQSMIALLFSSRPNIGVTREDGALAMLLTIDACGEINTIEGAGGVSSSGARTSPYEKFVPGGNPNGGTLPGRSAAQLSGLVENHWREGHGADAFREPLKEGQKEAAKELKKDKTADPVANFMLTKEDGTGAHFVHAPFFGPHANEQEYPPAAFLVDYAEFYRSYKTCFMDWVRQHGAGDDEAANAEKWAELLAGLNKLDGSITFDQLIEQVYGVPISGKDGSTDSLEWRFLRALPKLK